MEDSLFAMCSATDSYDIALAIGSYDGVEAVYDGTSTSPELQKNLDYSRVLPSKILK